MSEESGRGTRFAFGENWESFLAHLDEDRIDRAVAELREAFELSTFEGKSFLDAGCGSGLFSLAASRLGATRIVSFDYDPQSVASCNRLANREEITDWEVQTGDLLDVEFLDGLGTFDLVYCWGVAHHTGDMWNAIANLPPRVNQGGKLCLGIYNRVERDESIYTSHRARQVKQLYHRIPGFLRRAMVYGYGTLHLAGRTLLKRDNPMSYVRSYRENRGMEYWHDVEDWLGGMPFEYASTEEVERLFEREFPEFEHCYTQAPSTSPEAVNTYLYQRLLS